MRHRIPGLGRGCRGGICTPPLQATTVLRPQPNSKEAAVHRCSSALCANHRASHRAWHFATSRPELQVLDLDSKAPFFPGPPPPTATCLALGPKDQGLGVLAEGWPLPPWAAHRTHPRRALCFPEHIHTSASVLTAAGGGRGGRRCSHSYTLTHALTS